MELYLGIMELQDAKRIQAELKNSDIHVELKHNEQTCTRGCTIKVEMWGEEKNLEVYQEYFAKEQARHVVGLEVDPALVNAVFDPNSEEVVCQACGFKFKPAAECPDCGLSYA